MIYLSNLISSNPDGGDGGGSIGSHGVFTYEFRDGVRDLVAEDGDLVIIESLGIFSFSIYAEEEDDDETVFKATDNSGFWILEVPGWDYIYATFSRELQRLDKRIRVKTFECPSTSIVNGGTVYFPMENFDHHLDDVFLVTRGDQAGYFDVGGYVDDDETLMVSLTNVSGATRSTSGLTVRFTLLRGDPLQ